MKLIIVLSFLLSFCFPLLSSAEIPAQLKNDFATISGTIIMPMGDEYLIDLDASVNLREGDIMTLVVAGKKVIHPETKAVLGTIDQPLGFLQVTRIKTGYSYLKLLTPGLVAEKGDRVVRFEQTPARFVSNQPVNDLGVDLKNALPQLNWLNETDKAEPELIFFHADNQLKVSDRLGVELRIYPYKSGKLSVPVAGISSSNTFQVSGVAPKSKSLLNQAVDRLGTTIGFGTRDKRLENPGITQSQQLNAGIWMGPNLDGNPIGIAVADFDGDGQLETAVAMENQLQILRMAGGKMTPVAVVDFPTGVNLLSLDTIDIDGDGKAELYLTANSGTKLSSQVVEFRQNGYQRTISRVPWFLRVVDLPQAGRTLIAQTLGAAEDHFYGQPFVVVRTADKLIRGSDLSLPHRLNLFSFITLKGADNDLLYAYISSNDYLHVVTPGGVKIWESATHFGGSETFFYPAEDHNQELVQPVFVQQRLINLPSGEILAVQNDGTRIFQRFSRFHKSRVVALKWDGFALQESWQTTDQGGYLADFTLADADNDGQDELVKVVKFKRNNLLQKGRSAVVIYELNQ